MPKLKCRTVYTYKELDQEAKDRAFADWEKRQQSDPFTPRQEEIFGGLGALCDKTSGVTLKDYDLCAFRYSSLKVEFAQEEAAELHGARAMAWVENNLLSLLRVPWGLPKLKPGAPLPDGYSRSLVPQNKEYPHGLLDCDAVHHITRYTKPGAIPSCPFTGYYADDDYLNALLESVRAGDTLREAFEGLASEYCRLIEQEIEYNQSRECFEDGAAHDGEYLVDGEAV